MFLIVTWRTEEEEEQMGKLENHRKLVVMNLEVCVQPQEHRSLGSSKTEVRK